MKMHLKSELGLWKLVGSISLALLFTGATGLGQSAGVARSNVVISPDPVKKQIAVTFRLVDDLGVISARTAADGGSATPPTTWEAMDGDKTPACAWMIVIDTSNPARKKTVEKGVEHVREFLRGLPKQDSVAVYSLSRDLQEVVPFGKTPEEITTGLALVKPTGDAALTTLIFSNLRQGLTKLDERKEPRKAVLLLTDGWDETPIGMDNNKDKLIESARKSGVVLHTVGYAETTDGQKYFGSLKEISADTEGIFTASSLDNKELPAGTFDLLAGVMHGAGTAHIDVAAMTDPKALTLTVKTASGKTASIPVPMDKVTAALSDPVAPEKAAKEKSDAPKPDAEKPGDIEETKPGEGTPAADTPVEIAKSDPKWLWIGGGALLVIVLAAIGMVNASRKRAAEEARQAEENRLAEEERMAAEARTAAETRRADPTVKVEATPLAWLEMCDAQQTRHPVRIPNLKIGRGQHNDFVLRNDSVSGNHCVLNCNRDGEWSVTDLNSGNGVLVNGVAVKQAALRHGDVIELGELKMRFLLRV